MDPPLLSQSHLQAGPDVGGEPREEDGSLDHFRRGESVYQPCGVTDGPEDAAVAEDDDGEGDEEDEGEEQHRVGPHRRGEGHVVPGAGSHQAFWYVRTCGGRGGGRAQLVVGSIPHESEHRCEGNLLRAGNLPNEPVETYMDIYLI